MFLAGKFFFHALVVFLTYTSRYVDPRTRKDRIDIQNANWTAQMECLVKAYLDFRTRDRGDGMPSAPNEDEPVLDHLDTLTLQNIELVDIFSDFFFFSVGFVLTNNIQVESAPLCSLNPSTTFRMKVLSTTVT